MIKNCLIKLDNCLVKFESYALIMILLAMLIFSSLQIFLRIFFNTSIVWIAPLLRALVLWTAFFGGALAIQRKASIKIDIFNRLLSDKKKNLLQKILSVVGAIVSFYLFIIAIKFIINEKSFGDIFFLKVKVWHIELIFAIGFFLMTLHFILNCFITKEEK